MSQFSEDREESSKWRNATTHKQFVPIKKVVKNKKAKTPF